MENTVPGAERAAGAGASGSESADRFWERMDLDRAAARSLARAHLALGLLDRASIRGGRLLDVGCGPGWALDRFRAAGFDALGLEASTAAASQARARGLAVDVQDIESAAPPGPNRVVTALEVLEHVREPLSVLKALSRAVEPGGRLVVSLPNEFHLLRRLAILAGRPGWAGHRRFGGHDDPHLRYFTPREAERLFAAAGLCVLDRAFDGLAPPRWRLLRPVSAEFASLWPSLFAHACVYLLRPEASAPGSAPP